MTFTELIGLIYLIVGGLTGLEIRILGIPYLTHYCSQYEGCNTSGINFLCPRAIGGCAPLSLWAWAVALVGWPLIWCYMIIYILCLLCYQIGKIKI